MEYKCFDCEASFFDNEEGSVVSYCPECGSFDIYDVERDENSEYDEYSDEVYE